MNLFIRKMVKTTVGKFHLCIFSFSEMSYRILMGLRDSRSSTARINRSVYEISGMLGKDLLVMWKSSLLFLGALNGPHREKTCLRGV